jgi:hypothetical protein
VHVLLLFLQQLASIRCAVGLLDHAPWIEIASFLNGLLQRGNPERISQGSMSSVDQGHTLPEDCMVLGQIWTRRHPPEERPGRGDEEEEGEQVWPWEPASNSNARAERILRIGYEIASVSGSCPLLCTPDPFPARSLVVAQRAQPIPFK